MPPKKEGEKSKPEKSKDDTSKDDKGKNQKSKDKNKAKKKLGEGGTVGYVDKPNRCKPEIPTQIECPPPSNSCPPPTCCQIPSYFPEEPRDCATTPNKSRKPKNLDLEKLKKP